jgi:DNA polymerase-1
MRLIIDTETNAIDFKAWNAGDTSSLKQVHCICAIDADTGEEYTYSGNDIALGLIHVYSADVLIGHNIQFDTRVMEAYSGTPLPDRIKRNCTYKSVKAMFPNGFREHRITNPDRKGSNSLEAWGYRLGVHKDKVPVDWSKSDPMMLGYCLQDCRVTLALHRFIERRKRWGVLSPLIESFIS